MSQAPVKPHELDLESLFSAADESMAIAIYQAIQDEGIDDGESPYTILEERDVVSDEVLSLYKKLLQAE